MSSFFGKEEAESENLQYDDVAFYHFFISICGVIFAIVVFQILTQFASRDKKPIPKLKKTGLFKHQLPNESKRNGFYFLSKSFLIKFTILLILAGTIYYFADKATNQSGNMIGFDPYQILGVSYEATTQQIKKSYRKLALIYHPDRNPHNPQVGAKFIMISKAYDSLTDQKGKQNWKKYGNPDGEQSFKVGIGLPSFVINAQNQFYVLPAVFFLLLVLIPFLFIKWNDSLRAVDQRGLQIGNYETFWKLLTPNFNIPQILVMFASMQQLNDYSVKVSDKRKAQLIKQISQYKAVPLPLLQVTPPECLETLKSLIEHMLNKKTDYKIAMNFETEFHKLLVFSLQYCKASHHGQPLNENQKMPIIWLGTNILRFLIEFQRRYYNRLFGQNISCMLELLDLNQQQTKIIRDQPTQNIVGDVIHTPDQINLFTRRFPQPNREYIRKQLSNIPLLDLTIQILVDENPVNQFTTADTAIFSYTINKTNQTTGWCDLRYFPFLKQEKFYFLITYDGNLLHFDEVKFKDGRNEYQGKWKFQQNKPKRLQFMARVVSDCYYGIDIQCPIPFQVLNVPPALEVQINKQDREIQKMPKTFVQSIFSIQIETSDQQFSEDEDQEGGTIFNTPFKNKNRLMEEQGHQHGQNCDHQHDDEHDDEHDSGHEHDHHECDGQHEHEHQHDHQDDHQHGNCNHHH